MYKKIFEIQNKGKGLIDVIYPDDLLLITDYEVPQFIATNEYTGDGSGNTSLFDHIAPNGTRQTFATKYDPALGWYSNELILHEEDGTNNTLFRLVMAEPIVGFKQWDGMLSVGDNQIMLENGVYILDVLSIRDNVGNNIPYRTSVNQRYPYRNWVWIYCEQETQAFINILTMKVHTPVNIAPSY